MRRRGAPSPRVRSGFALLGVLVALTLLTAFAVGAAFLAGLESRGDRAARRGPEVQAVAESLAVATLAAWPGGAAARLTIGDSIVRSGALAQLAWRTRVVRLTRSRYLVTASTEDDARGVRGGVWLAVRRDSLADGRMSALTVRGALEVRDRARVDSADAAPAGWVGCSAPLPDDDVPVRDTLAAADGSAPVLAVGAVPWDTLWARADVRVEPPVSPAPLVRDGRCETSLPDANWGEPRGTARGPCDGYFPVIAASGDVVLGRRDRGQGVLLVDGDLDIRDDAYFAGVVLVRGRLTMNGAARIDGAVRVLGRSDAASVVAGEALVRRSTCAVGRALAAAGAIRTDGPHAWAPLY